MAVNTVQAIINGQTYTLTLDTNTGEYKAQPTAPMLSSFNLSGGYYPVMIKATDLAGNLASVDSTNAEFGAALKLVAKEKTAPVIAITYPSASALLTNNKPQISFKVTDNDSGVNSGSIKLIIDGGAAITSGITKTAITGGYQCTYTPATALTDGSHTIKVDASDNDGNTATQKTVTFKIDTVPPTHSVTSPLDGLVTNNSTITISGVTNDATSSPCKVTIKHNSNATIEVPVNADGSYSKQFASVLVEGENIFDITSTDSASKFTTIRRTVILDTKAPVFKSIVITPNPVDCGATVIITVRVED